MSHAKPVGAFRVLHTADWHLGKMLGDLSREQEHECFFKFLLETIVAEQVDVLLVAGDVFDSANPPQSALRQYYEFLSKIYRESECSVVIVAGNHDSPTMLESPRDVLKPLRAIVVGMVREDPVVILPSAGEPRLAVAAIPFLRDRDLRTGQMGQGADAIKEALVRGIAKRYADAGETAAKTNLPALAMGHLTVIGGAVAESEREIHVGGLGAVTVSMFPEVFDYVALGHLHRPQACGGEERVRYSGSPIPLSFSEAKDVKEVRILDFGEGGLLAQYGIVIPAVRRLVQIRTKRVDLEKSMWEKVEVVGDLRPWVEVLIEDSVMGENVLERVRELAEGEEFDVVRVVCEGGRSVAGVRESEVDFGSGEAEMLGDPMKVFALRLERELGLDEGEQEALTLAFGEVLNRYQEGEVE